MGAGDGEGGALSGAPDPRAARGTTTRGICEGVVSLRLPDDVARRLQRLADRTGRSRSFYLIEAIEERLDDLEDLYLAEQRLIDLRAGKSGTVPLDEVMKQYGMDD